MATKFVFNESATKALTANASDVSIVLNAEKNFGSGIAAKIAPSTRDKMSKGKVERGHGYALFNRNAEGLLDVTIRCPAAQANIFGKDTVDKSFTVVKGDRNRFDLLPTGHVLSDEQKKPENLIGTVVCSPVEDVAVVAATPGKPPKVKTEPAKTAAPSATPAVAEAPVADAAEVTTEPETITSEITEGNESPTITEEASKSSDDLADTIPPADTAEAEDAPVIDPVAESADAITHLAEDNPNPADPAEQVTSDVVTETTAIAEGIVPATEAQTVESEEKVA